MRDIVVTLIVFGAIPIIFVRPYVGILMWCWLAYMNPHKLTWGFAYDFPFAMVIAVVTIAAWLVSREPKRIPLNGLTVLLALLAFWVSLTTVFALKPAWAFAKWQAVIKILLMTFLTISLMGTRQRIDAMIWVIVVSIGFYGVKGGLFVITGGTGIVFGPPEGFFGDNTSLAVALVMTLPLMRYLQLQAEKWWIRWGMGAAMILTGVAIVGTYSRGALLASIAIIMMLVMKSRKRGLFLVFGLIAIGVSIPLIPDAWYDRMATIEDYSEDGSALGRIQAWTFGYKLALQRPIVGGGFKSNREKSLFAQLVPEAETSRAYHSIYFETLGDHGFVGLTIFLFLGIAAFFGAQTIIRNARGREDRRWARDLANMTQVSVVGYATGGAFLSMAFFDLYYHLVALLVLIGIVLEKSESRVRFDHVRLGYDAGPVAATSSPASATPAKV